jgi:hypothetical protein
MEPEERIQKAMESTWVVRPPRQNLATFGATTLTYYIVTELSDLVNVVRDGRVVAEKPRIVTPAYLSNLEGFSTDARRYIEMMLENNPREPALFYRYKNEPRGMDMVYETSRQVIDNISNRLENAQEPLAAIIKGVEEAWDVSLLKFTYELTRRSLAGNISEMQARNLLRIDRAGLPADARENIEELFSRVARNHSLAPLLVAELRRWNVYEDYEDRFLTLFRQRA